MFVYGQRPTAPLLPPNAHGPPLWCGWVGGRLVLAMFILNVFGSASDCNDSLEIENVWWFIKDLQEQMIILNFLKAT